MDDEGNLVYTKKNTVKWFKLVTRYEKATDIRISAAADTNHSHTRLLTIMNL